MHTRADCFRSFAREAGVQAAAGGLQFQVYSRHTNRLVSADLHDVVFEMLDSLGKGFSATEIIWDPGGDQNRELTYLTHNTTSVILST